MDRVSSEPYLSGYTYASLANQGMCDKGDTPYMHEKFTGIKIHQVTDGEILYVTGNKVSGFFKTGAKYINEKYKLITAQWDEGVTESIINNLPDNIIRWYTINANIDHDKITPIPLGLQNLHWRRDDNLQSNPATYQKYHSFNKTKDVLASFSVRNRSYERQACLDHARKNIPEEKLCVKMFSPTDRKFDDFVDQYFQLASEFRFILCPWGAGYDTHRLWEAMYLGAIPVTRMCPAYRDFRDYPIIFIDKWENLSMDYLNILYDQKLEQLKVEPRIYFDYWKKVITS